MFKTRRSKSLQPGRGNDGNSGFALIAVCAGGIFLSIKGLAETKIAAELIRNLRWPAEFMANEIRNSANLVIVSGKACNLNCLPEVLLIGYGIGEEMTAPTEPEVSYIAVEWD